MTFKCEGFDENLSMPRTFPMLAFIYSEQIPYMAQSHLAYFLENLKSGSRSSILNSSLPFSIDSTIQCRMRSIETQFADLFVNDLMDMECRIVDFRTKTPRVHRRRSSAMRVFRAAAIRKVNVNESCFDGIQGLKTQPAI